MANSNDLRREFTSIVDLLPFDGQRLVNEALPRIEAFVDGQVDAYGRDLARFLADRVKAVAASEEVLIDERLGKLESACTALAATDHEERLTSAINSGRSILREVEDMMRQAPMRRFAATQAAYLNSALQRLREEHAIGRSGTATGTFKRSYAEWKRNVERSGVQLRPDEMTEMDAAVDSIPSLDDRDDDEFAQRGLVPSFERVVASTKTFEQTAKQAAEGIVAEDRGLKEASRHAWLSVKHELDRLLERSRSGADPDDVSRQGLVRAIASAAEMSSQFERHLFAGPLEQTRGVVEAMAREDEAEATEDQDVDRGVDGATAQAAVARALAYFDSETQTADSLDDLLRESQLLGESLEKVHVEISYARETAGADAQRRAANHRFEASLLRLDRLVDQAAARLIEAAETLDTNEAISRLDDLRTELDKLTEVGTAFREVTDRARSVTEDGVATFQRREALSKTICRAIKDGVGAAKLRLSCDDPE